MAAGPGVGASKRGAVVIGTQRAGSFNVRLLAIALALLVTLLALLGALVAWMGGGTSTGPQLSLQEREHHFGQLSANQPLEYRFAFKNTGNRPLEIGDIRLQPAHPAGCT